MAATPGRPTGNVRYDNADRVILVTGGVTGIGRAIVDRFHQTGATVFSFDVTPNDHENIERKTFLEGDTASFDVCKARTETRPNRMFCIFSFCEGHVLVYYGWLTKVRNCLARNEESLSRTKRVAALTFLEFAGRI